MNNVGYSGYGDAAPGMGEIHCEGQTSCPYVPDLAPVGSTAAGTYYPRSVDDDASALNFLGYGAGFPGGGNGRAEDMSRQEGAFDTTFQAAVTRFQQDAGIGVDGRIGPQTRGALLAAVTKANASSALNPNPLPFPKVPPFVPGVLPGPSAPSPSKPGPAPVVAAKSSNTLLIAGGVAAAGLAAWYFLKK